MKSENFVDSFNAAIEGFFYVLKYQRNMRIHFLSGFLILLLALCLDFSSIEFVLLLYAIASVLVLEMINTAIEYIVDSIHREYNKQAKVIKDISAGVVLIAAMNAIIIGYFLFKDHVTMPLATFRELFRDIPSHVTVVALLTIFVLTVFLKVFLHKGTPLRGGMPSGHSALAFSIWTVVLFLTNNALMISLVLVLAVLVARSRYQRGIHTVWEIVAGALLGMFTTAFFFRVFTALSIR